MYLLKLTQQISIRPETRTQASWQVTESGCVSLPPPPNQFLFLEVCQVCWPQLQLQSLGLRKLRDGLKASTMLSPCSYLVRHENGGGHVCHLRDSAWTRQGFLVARSVLLTPATPALWIFPSEEAGCTLPDKNARILC